MEMQNQIRDMTATIQALQAKIDTKPTFAEKTKDNAAVPAQDATKTGLVEKPVTRDLSKILTVSKTNTYENSVAIKKNFDKHFPRKRLVFAFHTVRGNIHLEFFTKDESEEVFTSWKSNFLGSETLIKKAVDPEKPNFSPLINGVPSELEDSNIEKLQANDFEGMKSSRFIKKDGTKLETVKLVAKNLSDVERAVRVGIYIESLFYRPIVFQQRSIQVIRCSKYQRFGHVSKNCKSQPRCGHCLGRQNFKSCDKKDGSPHCAN